MSLNQQNEFRSTLAPSILASLGQSIEASGRSDYDEMNALERKLNYQSACTVKALSPFMQVISFEQAQGMSDVDAADLCKRLVTQCRKASADVSIALELSDDSANWARSYYAGVIASEIASCWPRLREKALDIDWAVSLSEIAKPILNDGLPPVWKSAQHEVSIVATMMNAMQPIMQAYDTFHLFHRDRESMQDQLSQILLDASVREGQKLADLYKLTDESALALTQSFMKNGGKMLAALWEGASRRVVDFYINQASASQKEFFRKNGYPIEDIQVAFERQLEGMASVSAKTMEEVTNFHNKMNASLDQGM